MAKFPNIRMKDPFAKAGLAPWKKWCIAIACLAAVFAGLWMFNLLEWAKLPSPLERYHKKAPVETVVDSLVTADTVVVEIEVPADASAEVIEVVEVTN
jgi:hypothetical protein